MTMNDDTTREGGEGVARLLAALGKIMPISTHNTSDYAEVSFGGEGHSSQAMTMHPADWNEINAAYEALATTSSPDASPDSGEAGGSIGGSITSSITHPGEDAQS